MITSLLLLNWTWGNSVGCTKIGQNETNWKHKLRVAKLQAAGCGLRATDCIAGCGLEVTDCGLHTQVVGCGPQISGWGLRATLGLRAAAHRLRAVGPCCGLLKLLVAKLQVAKMSCCGLLNCGLRFARLSRLGGCQLLDLSGYNMGYRLLNKWKLFPPC